MLVSQKKSYIYIIAALCAVTVGFITHQLHHNIDDLYPKQISSMVFQIISVDVLIAWCVSIRNRILNKQIRMYLILVGLLMIFWLTVRIAKWRFLAVTDPLGRYFWYAYYIPMILIPLFGVFIEFSHDFKTKFYKNNYSPEFKRVFYDVIIDLPL